MPNQASKIGLFFGAAAGLAGAAYYLLFRRPLPEKSGSITLSGLHNPTRVIRDQWGVPHIFAESLHDLMFTQGFVHAQDRLWQMEFNRRLVAGRLSEILGPVSIPLDRWMRILGMRRTAEKEFPLLSQSTQKILESYAAGVNARIAQGRLPIEFNLLRFHPEPWTVTDTLSWPKMMAWTLSVNWEAELLRAQIAARIGVEKLAELEMLAHPQSLSVIPPDVDFSSLGKDVLKMAEQARRFTGPTASNGIGSNNWVVSGQRTTTGMPLLANDMHLELSIPAIWYENHLQAKDIHASGISLPGIPGIIAGHNQHVAWGYTNGFPDVQDLFIEHLRQKGPGQYEYVFKDEWVDAQVIPETIQVKGQQPVVEEVIQTRHGPIINKLAPDFCEGQTLALSWVALEPSNMLDSISEILAAKDCQELHQTLRNWSCPSQNTVCADTKGNIAYRLSGKVPIRKKGDGRFPVPGWTGEYEWEGYIPFDEMPVIWNPPSGTIATANNCVAGENYPYHLSYDYCTCNRAERIDELLKEKEKISIDDIRQMHFDQVSIPARKMARLISHLESSDPQIQAIIARMRTWNGDLSVDSPEASVYEILAQNTIPYLLKDKLGDLTVHYAGKGPTPFIAGGSILSERSREWLDDILEHPDSHWWNLGNGEHRDDILLRVLAETINYLKENLGPEFEDWGWGKLHKLVFSHPLGSIKPLDKLFNRGPYPLGGDSDTVWATAASRHDLTVQSIVGPPFRFIADLGNLENCLGLLAPGQSGQPSSPHYADNIQAWFRGDYHPMLFNQETVEKMAKNILILEPPVFRTWNSR